MGSVEVEKRRTGMKKKWVVVIVFLFIVVNFTTFSLLKVNLSPNYLDIDVTKPSTQEIVVTNGTGDFVRYKLSFKKPKDVDEEYYMGDNLIIYPRVISLPPNESRKVRIRLKAPIDSEEKEFLAMIHFEELKGESAVVTSVLDESEVKLSAGISVDINYYIYGVPKNIVHDVKVNNIHMKNIISEKGERRVVALEIKNKGDLVFRGQTRLIMEGQKKFKKLKNFDDLFQGKEREFIFDVSDLKRGSNVKLQIVDRMDPNKVIFEEKIQI